MRSPQAIVVAFVAALGIVTVNAQEAHHFQFEIIKDGAVVAKPLVRVAPGQRGEIWIGADGPNAPEPFRGLRERIYLTPTVQGDTISIAFDITSDTKKFRPSLVISKDIKGSFEWTSTSGQTIRLSLSWVE